MTQTQACPECGVQLPDNAPEGLCPQCLLKDALQSGSETPAKSWGVSTTPYQGTFAAPAPAELAPHFPQLEVLELLGQGGMGAVYKTRQPKLDRLVALKILPPEVGREPAFAERFLREARALARLSHPNIVALHDFGENGGLYYFLMEFVDGGNLRERLASGPLAAAEAGRIASQVCDAIQFAHEEGVVHRDIKPENILLDRKGRVKIADFGLARLLGTPGTFTLTGSQQIMGTPYYMSPEQMLKPHTVDHRADIYSLGVVLYEMLSGDLPLGRFALPSEKGLDGRWDAIVLRALAREPDQRYPNVEAFKRDLDSSTIPVMTVVPAEVVPAAASGTSKSLVTVPFSIPNKRLGMAYGFSSVWGFVHLEEEALSVEFEVSGLFRRVVKQKRVPLDEVNSITLEKTLWTGDLVLHGSSLATFEGLPGSERGTLTLNLAARDVSAAEVLATCVTRRVSGDRSPLQPQVIWVQRRMAELEDLRANVRMAAAALITLGVGSLLSWIAVVCVAFAAYARGPGLHPVPLACMVAAILTLPAELAIVLGAWRMAKGRNYDEAILAARLATWPWSPIWPLGWVVGRWALSVLRNPEVKTAFAHEFSPLKAPPGLRPNGARALMSQPSRGPLRKVGALFRSVCSFFVSRGRPEPRDRRARRGASPAPEGEEPGPGECA